MIATEHRPWKSRDMREYCVYIVRCSDGSLYTGITNDVERRLSQHNGDSDQRHFTASRKPVTLVYAARFTEVSDALAFETQIKRWSRRKKEALIAGEYEKLPALAKKDFSSSKHPPVVSP